jgi:hypothetical protein
MSSKIEYTKQASPANWTKIGMILVIAGLVMVGAGFAMDSTRTAFNSIVGLLFLSSVAVGALFMVALEYVAGAVWSTPYRRIAEILASIVLILPLFAIPGLIKMHDIFHWTHVETFANDIILKNKSPYLNTGFFIARMVFGFVVWMVFYYILTKNSQKQDTNGDQNLTKKNIKISAIFMPLFAITLTIMAIDWMMSLEPHWFSTIFGVYYFAGTFLCALAFITIIAITMNEKGLLVKGLGEDHYYSLGALLFAFINFWAYIAFSQYLLIWYANLPEETYWFIERYQGSWAYISYGMVFIHFVVPYIVLLPQPAKKDPKRLKFIAIWIIFAHIYDLYWLIMPTYTKSHNINGMVFSFYEIAFPVLAIGVILVWFGFMSKNKNLVPIGDPKLQRAVDFHL